MKRPLPDDEFEPQGIVSPGLVSLAIRAILCESNTPMTRTPRFTYSLFTYRYFGFGVAATAKPMCAPISS